MDISISTYQVKKEDTLQSVAEKLGISAEALKRYHNTYCELKNLIGNDLKGIQEILIPPKEKISEYKETQKNIELSNNLPSIYLTKGFYASSYEVTERFEQLDKEDLEINYSTSVVLRETPDKGFVAETKTSEFMKNGESPDDKISMLSLACIESVSPISFLVPAQGKIKGLYDHKGMVKKFENKKTDLEDLFIGEVSQSYFKKFYASLVDEAFLLKQFSSTLLYQVLFPEMDWFRRKQEWEEKFYLTANSFPLKCRFKTEYNHNNADDVETIINGNNIEDCSFQELIRGVKFDEVSEEKISGEIEIKYTTHKATKQLVRVHTEITLWHEGEQYSKHTLSLVAKQEKEKPKRNFNTLVDE
jgi:hypothetical protein